MAPAIVAEALGAVTEPLAGALGTLASAPAAEVARALARALAPPEAADVDAPWLWPEQRPAARRVVAAVRRFGGALLADPVGSGKSYVALAAARAVNGSRPTAVLAPATLVAQWERLAGTLGVCVAVGSHERASRGHMPVAPPGLVIVDESHWLRHPRTRRYRHLARWMIGRRALLLTATPAVNHLRDVASQLLLSVRDDGLAALGVPSIETALTGASAPVALGRLVLAAAPADRRRPRRERRTECAPPPADAAELLRMLDALALSSDRSVATLIRATLVRALASSPAAFRGALRRYRRLLEHAADAAAAGRSVTRAELRRLIGTAGDQLLLWGLSDVPNTDADLALGDLASLADLESRAALACHDEKADAKVARLAALVADRRPTLVFTAARDTVRWLRNRMGDPWVAWCTGARAGIGRTALPRSVVLDWFRATDAERDALPGAPRTLVATDVAAEGLDLRRVERVVHYDLPWTAMRLEQREGRALRAGTPHQSIEVIELRPAALLERRLRQVAIIASKAKLPAALDLGARGAQWRWRAELADAWAEGNARRGVATVVGDRAGALAGFAIRHGGDDDAAVVWLEERSGTEAAEMVERQLRAAAAAPLESDSGGTTHWLEQLAPLLRERLRAVAGGRWAYPPTAEARALVARLEPLAREAARSRDASRLAELERALAFAARGHTAGERALVAALTADPEITRAGRFGRALARVEASNAAAAAPAARLIGLIVFRPSERFRTAPSPGRHENRSDRV